MPHSAQTADHVDWFVAELPTPNSNAQLSPIPNFQPEHRWELVVGSDWELALAVGNYRMRGFHRTFAKPRTRVIPTSSPSARRSSRFSCRLPPYPPSAPPAPMTRWHGMPGSRVSRMMVPTARQARGEPASAAISPYVATCPGGMRRTAASTRCLKDEAIERLAIGAEQRFAFSHRQFDAGEIGQCWRDVGRRDVRFRPPGLDTAAEEDRRDVRVVFVR